MAAIVQPSGATWRAQRRRQARRRRAKAIKPSSRAQVEGSGAGLVPGRKGAAYRSPPAAQSESSHNLKEILVMVDGSLLSAWMPISGLWGATHSEASHVRHTGLIGCPECIGLHERLHESRAEHRGAHGLGVCR